MMHYPLYELTEVQMWMDIVAISALAVWSTVSLLRGCLGFAMLAPVCFWGVFARLSASRVAPPCLFLEVATQGCLATPPPVDS